MSILFSPSGIKAEKTIISLVNPVPMARWVAKFPILISGLEIEAKFLKIANFLFAA